MKKNKTIYIGSRKFVEGDMIPPFINGIRFEEENTEEYIKENLMSPLANNNEDHKTTRKRPGRPRKIQE